MFKKYLCVGLAAFLLIAETPVTAYAQEANVVQEIVVEEREEEAINVWQEMNAGVEEIVTESTELEAGIAGDEAVEKEAVEEESVVVAEEGYAATATSGYVSGTDNAISWTYDANTKTTTITGKGMRQYGFGTAEFPVESTRVVFKNCEIEGSLACFFSGMSNLESIDFSGLTMKNITDMSSMFYQCVKLKAIDTSRFDTSQVTNMQYMFCYCSALTKLDLSKFNTAKVTDMQSMFEQCGILTELNVSNFNTAKVTNMQSMFESCRELTKVDIGHFDTGNVTNMSFMFNSCHALTELNVSNFNTSKVKDMCAMFQGCSALKQLDVSGFDTSNVTNLSFMFNCCEVVKGLNVGGFNTSNALNLSAMFSACSGLTTLDLSNFDMELVNSVDSMLSECNNLHTIYTPEKLGEETLKLPNVFTNMSGKETQTITKEFENTVLYIKVPAPTIEKQGDKLIVKSSMPGTILCYTTDGSAPTPTHGTKVNGNQVRLDTFSGHLKAICVKGIIGSPITKMTLFESTKERNVSFNVAGTFGGRNVTFNSGLKGAKIYYSDKTSTLSLKDKCVNPGDTVLFEDFYGTIYTRTYKDGVWGNVCRFVLKIPVVKTPTIEVDSKGYATIRTKTPASHLIYTLDGTSPSLTNGKRVYSPYTRVYVGKGKTIKAIAVRNCFTNRGVATKNI